MREPDQGPNMSDEKIKEPSGIIAIMTQPDGNVIASAVDFDLSGYGGFELWEAQRIRAERSVKAKAIRALTVARLCRNGKVRRSSTIRAKPLTPTFPE
jgi:hypothetical protein